MKKAWVLLIFFPLASIVIAQPDSLVIQERQLGLCTWNGAIVTSSGSISGWTEPGFIDVENGVGKAVSWEIYVEHEGDYLLTWRYAFGGFAANIRDSKLLVDGNTVIDTVFFPFTGNWSNWTWSVCDHRSGGQFQGCAESPSFKIKKMPGQFWLGIFS